MDTPHAPPPPPPRNQGQKRIGPLPFIFIGCGGALLVATLFAALFLFLFRYAGRTLEPKVSEYFAQVDRGEYASIYDSAHEQLHQADPPQSFKAFLSHVHGSLGDLKSKSMQSFHINTNTSGGRADAAYAATFENGDATVSFRFLKAGGDWKLAAVHYESPLLESALHCPHCNAGLREPTPYCPHCGNALDAE